MFAGTFWNQIMKKKKNILFILIETLSDYKDNETRFSYKM